MAIKDYESAVRSCFKEDDIENLWYGGTDGKIGDDPNVMYVAITENQNWWLNKCVLRDWFFDYKKFETLPLQIDCQTYGVYCIWMKKEDNHSICPHCETKKIAVEFKTDLGDGDVMVCEDCYNEIEGEEDEWCEEHEQVMWKDGLKCGGCMDKEK